MDLTRRQTFLGETGTCSGPPFEHEIRKILSEHITKSGINDELCSEINRLISERNELADAINSMEKRLLDVKESSIKALTQINRRKKKV